MSETPRSERTLEAPPALWGWQTWASMATALVVIGLLATRVDFEAVWREIAAADKGFVLFGLLAHYATYYVRGGRWKLTLGHTPRRASRVKFGLIVFFYNFVDNLVPAKLGDVYASHMARINLGVRRSEALGSIVFLRMVDGWVVLALAAMASWWLFSSRLPTLVLWALIGGAIMALGVTGLMLALAILHRRMPRWVPATAQRMMVDLRARMVPNRKRVLGITLATIVIWALETLWIFALARAFGLEPSFSTVVFLTMIPLLASAFPLTPSGTGAVELAFYSSLVVVGTPATVATSFTFLNRVIDYWLHIALGLIAWGLKGRLGLRTWSETPVRERVPDGPPPATTGDPGGAYQFSTIRQRLSRMSGSALDFAIGRGPESPPDWVAGFARDHASEGFRRHTQHELEALLEAAAGMLADVYDVRVGADSILVLTGGRAAMSVLAAASIAPGDRVLVTEPGYPAFARVAAEHHARVTTVTLDPDRGFDPNLAPLRRAGSTLAAVNYPNNPTGVVLSRSALEGLLGRLEARGLLFNDAIYGPMRFGDRPFSLLGQGTTVDREIAVVELHALGKLFGLGPLGVAFLVGPPDRIERFRRYSDFASAQVSSLQVNLARECLTQWVHVDGVRERVRERLNRLREVVTALGFRPYPTPAGIYLACPAPPELDGRAVASAEEAAEILLRDHGLAVASWDVPPHGYLRFSSSYLPEDLGRLAALGNGSPLAGP